MFLKNHQRWCFLRCSSKCKTLCKRCINDVNRPPLPPPPHPWFHFNMDGLLCGWLLRNLFFASLATAEVDNHAESLTNKVNSKLGIFSLTYKQKFLGKKKNIIRERFINKSRKLEKNVWGGHPPIPLVKLKFVFFFTQVSQKAREYTGGKRRRKTNFFLSSTDTYPTKFIWF